MKIVTGNKNKQDEIKQFINFEFIDIDLKEVYSNKPEIIVAYKAQLAKEIVKDDVIVEDITMYVNNKFYPDIKWKQNELKDNDIVELVLSVAVYTDKIRVYQKRLRGIIKLNKCNKYDFGFDNIFFIKDKCLGDYKKDIPLRNLYKNLYNPEYTFSKLPEWNGKYQNS